MSSWHPSAPHYPENPEHRPPPPSEVPPQHSYPPSAHHGPPPHSQPPYHPPPPARENSGPYPPDSYSRQGSVSAPTRSPAEQPRNHYPPHPAPHDSPYYHQPPPDYHRPGPTPYGPPEPQTNGTHPPPLHVQTNHEMMAGQPPGHPHPPPHHAYGHPPPHSAPPPPTPGGYYPPPYYGESQQRRKPVRAAQACDSCRQRKAKCDEGRPECQHCKDNNLKCTYRELPPQKSEKHVVQITEKLELLTSSIDQLLENQKSQQQQIQRLVEMQGYNQAQAQSQQLRPQQHVQQHAAPLSAEPISARPPLSHLKSEDSQAQPAADDTGDDGTGKDDKDKLDFSMPPKHTTAVHNLFDWPLIKRLLPPKQSRTYVNDLELGRGLLRLYGCGEGEDKGDGHEGASPAGSQSDDGRPLDDETSSSTPNGVWGNGQLPQPPTSNEQNARDHPGGLSPRGGLMLDSAAVNLYFQSYMDNMHILHPFMETKVLRQMVHTFKNKYSWDWRPNHAVNSVIGSKRKREATDSPTPIDELSASFTAGSTTRPQRHTVNVTTIEHSVANAIVLLVLALGKITLHRDPLPGPVATATLRTSTPQPHSMYATLSDLPFTKSAPASPYNQLNGVHNGIAASPSAAVGKNMDSIPGLSYFAKAADILGELPGGVAVSHIQANLLAGLYMGQLARIIPSHHYISVACHACQVLIESTRYRKHLMGKNERNLVNFAFWSCLQLESDILAEVELPPSGITRYEGRQNAELPSNITLEVIPETVDRDNVLRFYSYQIQLRRTMNDVHTILYKRTLERGQKPVLALVKVLEAALYGWKGILGDWDWEEDDYQHEDINVARMRAKYYGARYIINRPILHYCLSITAPSTPSIKHSDSPQPSGLSSIPSPAQLGYSPATRSRPPNDMGPPSNGVAEFDEEILLSAQTCVEAAIRSTTVFDKVPRRLIITNVFGTAHAQFGNLLVLSATYTSPHPKLASLVPEKTLRHLFERTINLLQANSAISPVLEQDAKILQHVRSRVFSDHAAPNMSSSFSSQGHR